ncbi:hypothetical protein [Endozoicomonas arenosclerae]|uniref:hypothetical protein n=1 Tax=Endozoicomonas arenosclerae TaxID=1633495 RepID=UPI000785AFF1|nr:hypothetical protein [Endozoicomonas arenosclerae]
MIYQSYQDIDKQSVINSMHGIAWVMFKNHSIGFKNLFSVAEGFYQEIESRIKSEGKSYDITINTTQLMEKLFSRFGFQTIESHHNGFGPGLDQYVMKKKL